MSVKMKFGSKDIPFVYKGDKLVYPNPIKDGLLLWYDFRGMRNTDAGKEVAKDLSGNGNHGTLQNFNYSTSTSDFNLPDLYKNTRLIVKDPSDPIYSDFPNPPVGAVFNNYNPVSNKIVRGNIDMPALVNTLIANMKLYHLYNDSVFLENAELIGAYISSLVRKFSFYGADTWVVPNRVSLIDGEWTPLYGEVNTRTLLQAIYALSEVLKVTGSYGSEVYQLTQTIGLIHNNIKSRVTEGELRAAMNGAVYEYAYINEDTNALVFSWGEFGISSSDMIAKAMNSYIESMGEDVIYDNQGTEFTPQQILDGAAEHIKAVYDSGALTMEPTGLPYSFLQANGESETGMNWDWVDTQERGDTWFTNDTTLWIIEGISRLSQLTGIEGLYNIAKTYRDNFLALRELNHDSYDDKGDTRVIFYDRYNFDGSHLTDDVSISISGTALLWEVDEILGIKDSVLHSQMRDTLDAHIITSENSDINGAFGWDANDANSFIEMKATGEIYFSPFIQADLSVSSGYKDNTLVFDGVDDSLTIPELELDETAMTVMHDGKLYAYEDDKVLTVGEGGEIIGGSENLLVTPKNTFSEIETRTYRIRNGVVYWTQRKSNTGGSLPLETYASDLESDMTFSFKTNNDKNIRYYVNSVASGTKYVTGTIVKENDYFVVSMVLTNFIASPRIYFYGTNPLDPVSEVKFWDFSLVRGNTLPKEYSLAPSDYKTTTLTPASLTDLQLYNKTLRKDELLHNAESKGLKKLKPGVVVQDGLVLHYDFSHESNTSEYKGKAFDYSGNGNHGVLNNFNFTEESGYDGSELKFDGIDDYITTQGFANHLPTLKDFTIQLAYKRNTYVDTTVVFGNRTGVFEGAGGNGIELRSNANGYSFYIDDGVSYRNNLVPYQNEQTDLITLVRENGNVSTYFGGDFEKVLDLSEVGDISSGREMFLGSRPNNSYQDDGELFSFKIYNRPLTPEEIAHNYAIEKEKFNIG